MPNSLVDAASNSVATPGAMPAAAAPMAGATAPGVATPDATGAPPGMPGAKPQKSVTVPEVKDAIRKQAVIDHALHNLIKSGKPVPRKDVISACIDLVAKRALSAEEMAGYLTTLPQDPMQVRDWVAKHAANVEQHLEAMLGMVAGQEAPPPEAVLGGPAGGDMSGAPAAMPGGPTI